jgi:hypothetical protein
MDLIELGLTAQAGFHKRGQRRDEQRASHAPYSGHSGKVEQERGGQIGLGHELVGVERGAVVGGVDQQLRVVERPGADQQRLTQLTQIHGTHNQTGGVGGVGRGRVGALGRGAILQQHYDDEGDAWQDGGREGCALLLLRHLVSGLFVRAFFFFSIGRVSENG